MHVCIRDEYCELFGMLICSLCQQKNYYVLQYPRQIKGSYINFYRVSVFLVEDQTHMQEENYTFDIPPNYNDE